MPKCEELSKNLSQRRNKNLVKKLKKNAENKHVTHESLARVMHFTVVRLDMHHDAMQQHRGVMRNFLLTRKISI